jgi:tetratricopeptide (TPR) repeat protein
MDTTTSDVSTRPGQDLEHLFVPDQEATRLTELDRLSDGTGMPTGYHKGDLIADRYEVLAVHRGSIGVVYAAFDKKLRLPRALKALQPRYAVDSRMRELFALEAAVWIRLEKHPCIARAYGVEIFDGQPHVVTEYVRGGDLRAWIGKPEVTLAVAVDLALQIAQGMQHATRTVPGLVHRDLKPANVLVSAQGQAMVTDFGLAAAMGRRAGTPAYMAPEQWTGEPTDARTDVYAFGCMLAELLTGRGPFSPGSDWEQIHRQQAPRSPRAVVPEIPEPLAALVLACLSKDRGHRPAGWDEVVNTMARIYQQVTGAPARQMADHPLDTDELIAASHALGELGFFDDMLQACERALRLEPGSAVAWNNKGLALYGLQRFEDALESYDRSLAADPRSARTWNNKGVALEQVKRFKEALAAFDQAQTLDPHDELAQQNRKSVLAALGALHADVDRCDRLLLGNPREVKVWNDKGFAHHQLGEYEEAVLAYQRANQVDERYLPAWRNQGITLQAMGRHAEALAAYRQVLAMQPKHVLASFAVADLLMKCRRWEEAVVAYDHALSLDQSDVAAWRGQAAALMELHHHEEALAAFRRAVALAPGDRGAWEGIVAALGALGRHEEARAARAMRVDKIHETK